MAPKAEKKAPSHPPYQALIKEAISALKDRNGSSLAAITKYVGEKHNLPGPWKKTLSLQLKRLTTAGKLVKVLTTVACTAPSRLARPLFAVPSWLEDFLAASAAGRPGGCRGRGRRFLRAGWMLAARDLIFPPALLQVKASWKLGDELKKKAPAKKPKVPKAEKVCLDK